MERALICFYLIGSKNMEGYIRLISGIFIFASQTVCVVIYNKYQMSDYMSCTKCKKSGSALYYCCSLSNKVCYYCAKDICLECGKKKTRPISTIKIRDDNGRSQSQLNCKYCKKSFQKNSCVQFECKHICCFKCLSKKIIDSIKSGSWEKNWNRDRNKKPIECNCGYGSSLDLSVWMEDYCFCCGEKLFQSHKVILKFGLVIMEFCRNRIIFDDNAYSSLTMQDINRLSKECKSCSNLIDGYRKVVGLEDSYGCECNDCWKSGGIKRRNGRYEEKAKCIICQCQEKISSMVKREDFYLCQNCFNMSTSKQDEKNVLNNERGLQSSQKFKPQQKKKDKQVKSLMSQTRQCLICQVRIVNPDQDICQQCIKDNDGSPLIQQLKNSLKINANSTKKDMNFKNNNLKQQSREIIPEKQNIQQHFKRKSSNQEQMPDFKKKSSYNHKYQMQCVNCDRNIENQADSHFDIALCSLCIVQNQRQFGNFKRSASQSVSSARIREKDIKNQYKSIQEHRHWRKKISYQEFLKESQQIDIYQSLSKPAIAQSNEKMVSSRQQKPGVEVKSKSFAIQSIIQEVPDVDYITIRAQSANIVSCSICKCVLERNNLFSYMTAQGKQIGLCLHCQLLSQTKNL